MTDIDIIFGKTILFREGKWWVYDSLTNEVHELEDEDMRDDKE